VIDFTKEKPLSLAAVAERFGVAVKTVRAWARGVGGRRLETAKLGGKRFTSLEAIQRFSRQATEQEQLPLTTRSVRKRRKSQKGQRLITLHE
jgi:transposase